MRYHFRVSPPGDSVKLRILETDREGPLLAATFNGRRSALTTPALLRSFFSLPLVTFKIVAAIHWEALRLWLKGTRLVPKPDTVPAPGLNTILATGQHNDYTAPALSAAGRKPELRVTLWSSESRTGGQRPLRNARTQSHITDGSVHVCVDIRNARQCRDGACRPAPSGSAGFRLRLKAAARHARRHPPRWPDLAASAASSRARPRP